MLIWKVNLNKNADPDKYKYSGYNIGFDSCSEFPFPDGSLGENVITFGADMSSFMHIDDNIKDMKEQQKNQMIPINSRS